jgi:hypothetical protein
MISLELGTIAIFGLDGHNQNMISDMNSSIAINSRISS